MDLEKEDTSRQSAAVEAARLDLGVALLDLAAVAKKQARAAASKTGQPDLDAVNTAHRAVQRAGEGLDLAVYDLQTARGADG